MSINALGIAKKLIKPSEGLGLAAYRDPKTRGEPYTIGYGTTVYRGAGYLKYGRQKVMLGDSLTQEEAEDELNAELDRILADVLDELTVTLNDNELGALLSFSYNLGDAGDDLQIQRLNQGKKQEFADKLLEYIDKGSPVEAGLLKRRKAERALFLLPIGKVNMKATWINLVRHTVSGAPEYRAYLMDGGNCLQIKKFRTREDLIAILREESAGNVAIGEEGWHVAPVSVPTNEARLTSGGFRRDHFLDLTLDIGGEKFSVVSGQPNAQNLRRPEDPRSRPGNMEPIPQGKYSIGNIQWVSGADSYTGSWGPGLGPVWIPLTANFSDDRGSFGIHLDMSVPGSAGCIVLPNVAELRRLVAALRKYDPKTLSVEWGL